jgi:hypothetical protein
MDERKGTDSTIEPERSPSTPGPENVPSEADVEQDLPGVPQEADAGDEDGRAPTES